MHGQIPHQTGDDWLQGALPTLLIHSHTLPNVSPLTLEDLALRSNIHFRSRVRSEFYVSGRARQLSLNFPCCIFVAGQSSTNIHPVSQRPTHGRPSSSGLLQTHPLTIIPPAHKSHARFLPSFFLSMCSNHLRTGKSTLSANFTPFAL